MAPILNSVGIKTHMHVDDTQLWVGFGDNDELHNEVTARRRIVQAVSIISNFIKASYLELNPSKIQFIAFSRETKPPLFPLYNWMIRSVFLLPEGSGI